jgi:carbon-monoxide dehydrogenase medium subunit
LNALNKRINPHDLEGGKNHLSSRFEYLEVSSLTEASQLLLKHKDKAMLMAGGTDLLVNIKNGATRPRYVVDLHILDDLKGLNPLPDGGLRIGALATLSQVASHPVVEKSYQALHEAILTVGSPQIRNVGTVAGNICNASPAADTAPPLLIYQAQVNITGADGSRVLPVQDFFKGPGLTSLNQGEIVESIDLPPSSEKSVSCYLKQGRTRGMDLALAGVGVLVNEGKTTRLAFASVAPTPLRIKSAEKALSKDPFNTSNIHEALQLVMEAIEPVSDVRASRDYRLAMTAVLMKKALDVVKNRLSRQGV